MSYKIKRYEVIATQGLIIACMSNICKLRGMNDFQAFVAALLAFFLTYGTCYLIWGRKDK